MIHYKAKTKKKYVFLLPLLILALSACEDYATPSSSPQTFSMSTKSSVEDLSLAQIDDPIVFITEDNVSAWTSIVRLEDRFKACNVPELVVKRLSTNALVKSALNYPMNYLVFAYDDPQTAINLICDRSNLHKELLKRQDAYRILVERFALTDVDMSDTKSNFDQNYEVLSFCNEMFLEHFLSSGLFKERLDKETLEILMDAVRDKMERRLADASFSANSIEPLISIDRSKNLNISSVSYVNVTGTVTVNTYFGASLVGYVNEDYSGAEIVQMNNTALQMYPNAILRYSATPKYNCHSFAWHNRNPNTNNVWLDSYYNGTLQLAKYWTNDLYVSSNSSEAKIALYTDASHSAIVLSNGKYLSKWGQFPVMEHDPDYCPYDTSSMQYFTYRNDPLCALDVTGPMYPQAGENAIYSVSNTHPGMTYDWTVTYMDNASITPGTYEVISSSSTQCQLRFSNYGLYTVRFDGYIDGFNVAYGYFNAISVGE